ncbi:hypothetical protein HPG69_007687 [Diceros bicornis minor]|uniref:Uncharacterized protein n=1 Tax=Diceros bicornis minor TaxID=77932 RepID=A0A7J7EAG3_DICBM|nr:hypothetical protein HPG69_007687 [Diceros bicornis minor]
MGHCGSSIQSGQAPCPLLRNLDCLAGDAGGLHGSGEGALDSRTPENLRGPWGRWATPWQDLGGSWLRFEQALTSGTLGKGLVTHTQALRGLQSRCPVSILSPPLSPTWLSPAGFPHPQCCPTWPGLPHCSCTCPPPWSQAVPPGSCAFINWFLHGIGEAVSTPAGHVLPLVILPLVSWRDSPKKPVLSAHKAMMFRHLRTIKIPPPGHKFTLLRSPPEQVVKAIKLVPSSHLPLPC